MLVIPFLYGCVGTGRNVSPQLSESFSAAPNIEALDMRTSSVKDFVYALPPHSYHEATVSYAHDLIAKEAVTSRRFRGVSLESVDYVGDGSVGRSSFFLDRAAGVLWRYYFAWEPGSVDVVTRYRPVPGGWMIHDEVAVDKDKAEQVADGDAEEAV
ncbi:hypothetical protein HZ994_09265 [Akkermansiaceae bacterium]|nr:hypothetical protein HZ994_09260 [Akkermansiaceae bacterium]QTN32510.1 hypothetical protein HZ994_09265 [Akkermansiaceae bacterium]